MFSSLNKTGICRRQTALVTRLAKDNYLACQTQSRCVSKDYGGPGLKAADPGDSAEYRERARSVASYYNQSAIDYAASKVNLK